MLAGPDLLVVLVIALIVFGPKKLPELAKTIGKTLAELKKTTEDVKESIGIKELDEIRSSLTGMDLFTSLAERASTAMSEEVVKEASVPGKDPAWPPAEASPPAEVEDNLEKIDEAKRKNALQPTG